MSDTTLYQWRVFCTTTSTYQTVWSTTEPTSCPEDPINHTIDPNQTTIIRKIDDNVITIKEELVPTNGIYKFKGYEYTIPAGTPGDTTVIDITWYYPITLLNGDFDATLDHVGDDIDAYVVPPSPIGAIIANVSSGQTVISVSPTVFDYLIPGYAVKLTDGVNTDDLGECFSTDKNAMTITVQAPTVHAFSAASPTYVLIEVRVVEDLHVRTVKTYEFAKKKMGGKNIPANYPFRIFYKNNSGTQKEFPFNFEYMY